MKTKYEERVSEYNPLSSDTGIEQMIGLSNSFIAEPEMVTQMRRANEEARKYRESKIISQQELSLKRIKW